MEQEAKQKAAELWKQFVTNNPCSSVCKWPANPPLMFEFGVYYVMANQDE